MKRLLHDVLDPAVKHVQHAKTQRERIHNDNVYFTSSRHPKTHRHGRIKKYTMKRTIKFTEKNYKMKRNTFVFKEKEVFEVRRNIMNIMEKKMTTNILPVYKRKGRKKNTIFYHPVRLSSGIRQKWMPSDLKILMNRTKVPK